MNYKPIERTITLSGITILVPNLAIIKSLADTVNISGAADSALDTTDNLVYTVPSGKILHLIGIKLLMGAAIASSILIYQGDTENATTTLKASMILPNIASTLSTSFEFYLDVTIAAGKFLVYNPTASIEYIQFLGYEVDT